MTVADYEPPPPVRRARWPVFVAWVVILGCAGLIAGASRLRPRNGVETSGDPARQASTEVLIQARTAVGFHIILRQIRPAGGAPGGPSSLSAGLNQVATSPLAKLRAISAIGEVDGADAAMMRLDAMRDDVALPADLRPDVEALHVVYADGPAALDEPERAALLARHGWFARLALGHGLPPDDPARRAAVRPAIRAAWGMMAMFAAGGLGCLVGLGLLIGALVAAIDRRARRAYVPPPPGQSGPFAEAFAVYLLGMIVASLAIAWLLPNPTFAANWLLAVPLPLAILWPRIRGIPWHEVRAGFGWRRGRGLVRESLAGVAGYVAALPLLVLAVLLTSLLIRVSGTTPSHPIQQEVGAGGLLHTLQLYLLAAAYAPLVEETMFRGAFYHHVRRRLPWFAAALLVGVLFAAIHPQGWVGVPMLTVIALVFAALREWRGSIIAPVVCHACVNAVTMTMLVLITA